MRYYYVVFQGPSCIGSMISTSDGEFDLASATLEIRKTDTRQVISNWIEITRAQAEVYSNALE